MAEEIHQEVAQARQQTLGEEHPDSRRRYFAVPADQSVCSRRPGGHRLG
jgi:hypothetical protein